MPNILVDCHYFDSEYNGGRTYLKGIYSRAITAHPENTYYLAAKNIDKLPDEFPSAPNVRYVRLGSNNRYYRLLIEYPALIKRYKIDFAHFSYIGPFIKNTRWIISMHDVLFMDMPQHFTLMYRLARKLLFTISAKRADLLTTISTYSKDRIADLLGIPEEKIILAPCGIDDEYFEIPDKTRIRSMLRDRYQLDKYIIYVSRIEPRKNHQTLLQAFVELELVKHGYKLVFVGKQSISNQSLNACMDRLGITRTGDILVRLEDINDAELRNLVSCASLAVYPSLAEGFGMPPLESAMQGVPTICSNLTSMRDFDFFAGNHIYPGLTELKTRMRAVLLGNDATVAYEDIRDIIRERYSWQRSADTLMSEIRNCYSLPAS